MSTLPELRSLSSAELRSRIPSLERAANGPKTRNAHTQAASELRRIEKVLQEREEATETLRQARATADESWAVVGRLEGELAEARETAREAERLASQAFREASGFGV